jgi:hypothetical protein
MAYGLIEEDHPIRADGGNTMTYLKSVLSG